MKPTVLKVVSTVLTVAGGAIGIIAGLVDQKVMTAEVAKQVAEALAKK